MTGAGAVLDGCPTAAATGLLTVESAVMTNDRIQCRSYALIGFSVALCIVSTLD